MLAVPVCADRAKTQMTAETFWQLAGYCVLGIAVAAAMRLLTRTFWVFLLASATTTAFLLQLFAFLYLGFIDTWAYIVFAPSWFVALGCTIVYHVTVNGIHQIRSQFRSRER